MLLPFTKFSFHIRTENKKYKLNKYNIYTIIQAFVPVFITILYKYTSIYNYTHNYIIYISQEWHGTADTIAD